MHMLKISMIVFGIYLCLLGIFLATIPNFVLPIFGFDQVHDIWVRLLGVSFFLISGIYYIAVKENIISFYKYSALARVTVFLFIVFSVSLGLAPWPLLIFGIIDAVSGAWTFGATKCLETGMRNKKVQQVALTPLRCWQAY